MEPSSEAKERGKGYNNCGEAAGKIRHGGVSWRNSASLSHCSLRRLALPVHPPKWPKSSLVVNWVLKTVVAEVRLDAPPHGSFVDRKELIEIGLL
jgi:hypothetical protein